MQQSEAPKTFQLISQDWSQQNKIVLKFRSASDELKSKTRFVRMSDAGNAGDDVYFTTCYRETTYAIKWETRGMEPIAVVGQTIDPLAKVVVIKTWESGDRLLLRGDAVDVGATLEKIFSLDGYALDDYRGHYWNERKASKTPNYANFKRFLLGAMADSVFGPTSDNPLLSEGTLFNLAHHFLGNKMYREARDITKQMVKKVLTDYDASEPICAKAEDRTFMIEALSSVYPEAVTIPVVAASSGKLPSEESVVKPPPPQLPSSPRPDVLEKQSPMFPGSIKPPPGAVSMGAQQNIARPPPTAAAQSSGVGLRPSQSASAIPQASARPQTVVPGATSPQATARMVEGESKQEANFALKDLPPLTTADAFGKVTTDNADHFPSSYVALRNALVSMINRSDGYLAYVKDSEHMAIYQASLSIHPQEYMEYFLSRLGETVWGNDIFSPAFYFNLMAVVPDFPGPPFRAKKLYEALIGSRGVNNVTTLRNRVIPWALDRHKLAVASKYSSANPENVVRAYVEVGKMATALLTYVIQTVLPLPDASPRETLSIKKEIEQATGLTAALSREEQALCAIGTVKGPSLGRPPPASQHPQRREGGDASALGVGAPPGMPGGAPAGNVVVQKPYQIPSQPRPKDEKAHIPRDQPLQSDQDEPPSPQAQTPSELSDENFVSLSLLKLSFDAFKNSDVLHEILYGKAKGPTIHDFADRCDSESAVCDTQGLTAYRALTLWFLAYTGGDNGDPYFTAAKNTLIQLLGNDGGTKLTSFIGMLHSGIYTSMNIVLWASVVIMRAYRQTIVVLFDMKRNGASVVLSRVAGFLASAHPLAMAFLMDGHAPVEWADLDQWSRLLRTYRSYQRYSFRWDDWRKIINAVSTYVFDSVLTPAPREKIMQQKVATERAFYETMVALMQRDQLMGDVTTVKTIEDRLRSSVDTDITSLDRKLALPSVMLYTVYTGLRTREQDPYARKLDQALLRVDDQRPAGGEVGLHQFGQPVSSAPQGGRLVAIGMPVKAEGGRFYEIGRELPKSRVTLRRNPHLPETKESKECRLGYTVFLQSIERLCSGVATVPDSDTTMERMEKVIQIAGVRDRILRSLNAVNATADKLQTLSETLGEKYSHAKDVVVRLAALSREHPDDTYHALYKPRAVGIRVVPQQSGVQGAQLRGHPAPQEPPHLPDSPGAFGSYHGDSPKDESAEGLFIDEKPRANIPAPRSGGPAHAQLEAAVKLAIKKAAGFLHEAFAQADIVLTITSDTWGTFRDRLSRLSENDNQNVARAAELVGMIIQDLIDGGIDRNTPVVSP